MPFLAPVIAGAIGAGILGEIAIGAGLSLALGAASRALAPNPKTTTGGGQRLSLRTEANAARELIVGRAAVAGTLVYHQVFGPNGNDTLQLVMVLADHECDALETVYVNGKAVTRAATTGSIAEYPGMSVRFYAGTYGQTSDANLQAQGGGRWTTNDRGRGVCYVVVEIAYDQKQYTTGLPKFLFVVRGAKLYDIRKDSTAGGAGAHRWRQPATYEWTQNPAVIGYNYLRGVWLQDQRLIGMNAPASALPSAEWIAAANVCDEMVPLKDGGTERRYTANGVLSSATAHRELLSDITRACAGLFIETGGQLKIRPGAARVPVATITDDDLLEDAEIEITPKRPRSHLVNAVFGSFHDPSQQYEMLALPPRLSPADEAADGIRLEEHYALDLVTSSTQGQRILEIMRRRARQQRMVKVRLPAKFALLEAGDWIAWTSQRYGWSINFEIKHANVEWDLSVTVNAQEMAASVTAWTALDEIDAATGGTLPTAGPTFQQLTSLAVATVSLESGAGEQRPGLQVTWAPVTDPTVIAIMIEYRRVGDATALAIRCDTPGAGNYTFISGVQGSISYEVRALPVTVPPRNVLWTTWASVGAATVPQVVQVGPIVIPPGTIAADRLSPQAQFELGLATSVIDIQGSVADQITQALGWAQRAAEAATHGQLAAQAAGTAVTVETRLRQSANDALAEQITTAVSMLNGHTASITQLQGSYDGIRARWSVSLSTGGFVNGYVSLDGSSAGSTFGVLADRFYVAQPGVGGGTPRQVFTVGTINGAPSIGITGNLLIDGSVVARHLQVNSLDAITGNFGTMVAGRLLSATGRTLIDLGNDRIRIST